MTRMRYIVILGALAAPLPIAPLVAAPHALARGADARQQAGPVAPISALYAALTTLGHKQSLPFAQRAQLVAPAVERAFNMSTILQIAVGPGYQSLSDAQKQQLQTVFQQFTVARYVSNFSDSSDTLTVNPTPRPSPYQSDQIVRTQLVSPSGDSTKLDYVMRRFPQGWQATDVLLDGHISQVAVQRSDFASTLASGGINDLIEKLKEKIRSFSES